MQFAIGELPANGHQRRDAHHGIAEGFELDGQDFGHANVSMLA